MKIVEAIFKFRGWTFTFKPVRKKKLHGRMYIQWSVIVEWRGKKYKGGYYAFTPSAHICRQMKRNKNFLNNPDPSNNSF